MSIRIYTEDDSMNGWLGVKVVVRGRQTYFPFTGLSICDREKIIEKANKFESKEKLKQAKKHKGSRESTHRYEDLVTNIKGISITFRLVKRCRNGNCYFSPAATISVNGNGLNKNFHATTWQRFLVQWKAALKEHKLYRGYNKTNPEWLHPTITEKTFQKHIRRVRRS